MFCKHPVINYFKIQKNYSCFLFSNNSLMFSILQFLFFNAASISSARYFLLQLLHLFCSLFQRLDSYKTHACKICSANGDFYKHGISHINSSFADQFIFPNTTLPRATFSGAWGEAKINRLLSMAPFILKPSLGPPPGSTKSSCNCHKPDKFL